MKAPHHTAVLQQVLLDFEGDAGILSQGRIRRSPHAVLQETAIDTVQGFFISRTSRHISVPNENAARCVVHLLESSVWTRRGSERTWSWSRFVLLIAERPALPKSPRLDIGIVGSISGNSPEASARAAKPCRTRHIGRSKDQLKRERREVEQQRIARPAYELFLACVASADMVPAIGCTGNQGAA